MDRQVQLRAYRDDDAAAIRACIVELQEYERAIDPRLRPGTAMAAEYFTQMLDRCRVYAGRIFIVECGGQVAGFVTVLTRMPFQELDDPPGEFALVSDLVVLKHFRRRGYGTALLHAAEQYAVAQGAGELRIGVLSANHTARRLYLRAGFDIHIEVLAKRSRRRALTFVSSDPHACLQVMTPRFDVRRRPLDFRVIVSVAIWISACTSPTSSGIETIDLAGVIRDTSQRPVGDVRVEIISGAFAGRFTMSNAQGRFQFVDPPSVAEPVTLRVSKAGYLPTIAQAGRDRAIIVTISAEPAFLPPGEYSITFTTAAACTALPASVRSRTYSSTLNVWETMSGAFSTVLREADFFPDLRTISGRNRGVIIEFSVYSAEAFRRWLEDLPIYERVSATEYLSLVGTATAAVSGTATSLTTSFDGIMAYCARSTDPMAAGYPPQCTVPVIECRSDRHQLSLSRC